MNQLEYLPGIAGQSVQMDGPSAFVGIAEEMRSREWDYDLGYRDLITATRPARKVDVTFNADYATADYLRRVADADVMARTPGTFVAQKEWKQRGYILASDVDDIHYGRLSTGLKIALLDGAWWRLAKRSFVPEITTPEYRSATGETVTASGASGAPLHALTVDGKAVQDGTPTPDAPVDVQVVGTPNMCDSSRFATVNTTAIADYSTLTTYTAADGFILTRNADGSITASGTATSTHSIWLPLERELKTGETVTLTGCPAGGGTSRYRLDLYNTANAIQASDYGSGVTKTLTRDANRLRLTVYSGTWDMTFKPQLELGSTATPYVPYGSIGIVIGDTATPIDLQGNVLASLPDGTKDVLTVDSAGHCVLTKRVGQLALKVSEMNNSDSWPGWTNCGARAIVGAGLNAAIPSSEIYCNIKNGSGVFSLNSTGQSDLGLLPRATYGLTQSQWQSQYPNLVVNLMLKYVTPQTIDLGTIDMPTVPFDAQISVTAAVTPTITAEWQISRDAYLDYPHNYPHDYQATSSTADVTPSVLTPSDVYLVVFGPAVNPYVIVGGNRYQVNVTVPSGGYLTVNGRDKTIQLTLADGTVQNVFSSGVRGGGAGGGSYIFEKIPAGTSEVTYDGSFGFDLGWYEEEGEPPWNQS